MSSVMALGSIKFKITIQAQRENATKNSTWTEKPTMNAVLKTPKSWITLGLLLAHLGVAHALPIDGGGGGDGGGDGGGGGGGTTPLSRCLANTRYSFSATPAVIEVGGSAMLNWSIRPPSWCTLFNRVIVNGQNFGLIGSAVARPLVTTDYPLTLIVAGGFQTLGPITVAVNGSGIVTLSPGPQVTAEDIAQFDTRWMKAADLQQRLGEYRASLKNRQAWIAWGVFDDAKAMVQMFELTQQTKYLDHLRDINNVALNASPTASRAEIMLANHWHITRVGP